MKAAEKVPDLQWEVDHDHSDSSYGEDDLTSDDPPVQVLTERTTAMRAYDFSNVLMQLAQLLLSMAFMQSWLGGTNKTRATTGQTASSASVPENNHHDNDVEPIPQIAL